MGKVGGAGPTPKPRTTLFSALSYYPNSLWECTKITTVSVPTYTVLQKLIKKNVFIIKMDSFCSICSESEVNFMINQDAIF